MAKFEPGSFATTLPTAPNYCLTNKAINLCLHGLGLPYLKVCFSKMA